MDRVLLEKLGSCSDSTAKSEEGLSKKGTVPFLAACAKTHRVCERIAKTGTDPSALVPRSAWVSPGFAWVWLILFPLMAGAQQSAEKPEEEDPDIFLSINVGYNTAYRSESWVPVDVLVHNELSDLSGWVEVRKYGVGNELLSPVYRVPAECPEGSRKRFRLYCYLNPGVTRIEAWLYENGLPAVDVPAYTQPQPIEARDTLGLVLDDDTTNFGFLYESMLYADDLFSAERPKRFFRYGVGTRDLSSLPDYAECYDAFNMIVLGDIDPSLNPSPAAINPPFQR